MNINIGIHVGGGVGFGVGVGGPRGAMCGGLGHLFGRPGFGGPGGPGFGPPGMMMRQEIMRERLMGALNMMAMREQMAQMGGQMPMMPPPQMPMGNPQAGPQQYGGQDSGAANGPQGSGQANGPQAADGPRKFRDPSPAYTGGTPPEQSFMPDPKASPTAQLQQMQDWSHQRGGELGIMPHTNLQQDSATVGNLQGMFNNQCKDMQVDLDKSRQDPAQKKALDAINSAVDQKAAEAAQAGHPMSSSDRIQMSCQMMAQDADKGLLSKELGKSAADTNTVLGAYRQGLTDFDMKAGVLSHNDTQQFVGNSPFARPSA